MIEASGLAVEDFDLAARMVYRFYIGDPLIYSWHLMVVSYACYMAGKFVRHFHNTCK